MREDIHYFPHVCEQIVWSAPPSSLPALRAVSPFFRNLVDRRLLDHCVYYVTERRVASALLPESPIPCEVKWDEVRVLDLAMTTGREGSREGNAKATWVIEEPPGGSEVMLPEALPHIPSLQAVRCLNYQPTVFPHMLRYTAVPLAIYPASRAISWSPRPSAGGRIVGGGVRSPRAIIAFARAPDGGFSFYFRANQHEDLTIVLLPGGWDDDLSVQQSDAPPEYTESAGDAGEMVAPRDGWTFWICLTDEVAHHIDQNEGRCELVGLEGWDNLATYDREWKDRVVRDVGLEEHKDRLKFTTLVEWRKNNEDIWPLVAQT